MSSFSLNARQQAANELLASHSMHVLLYGGSRSGKTFLLCRAIAVRALRAANSRHGIFRFRFNHVKESVGLDTWPKMMRLCFPEVKYDLNKSDWFVTLPNGSEVWLGGLDDKDRAEKVLGKEYATILLNECSQIPYSSVEIVRTRLAQKTDLKLKAYYDENPPKKGHWTYKQFIKKVDPVSGQALGHPDNYVAMQINPADNGANLGKEYIDEMQRLSGARRKRFWEGEFADDNPNALWNIETFDKYRELGDGKIPDFQRVVIAVDPSGSDDEDMADNDAIGIIVAALGTNGNAYVLEDLTIKAGPAKWGAIATSAFDRHRADLVVGEQNYGGAMVKHVIQTARPDTPFKAVTASRGKVVRAEPISALYEQGKVRHVGMFPELEDELMAFTTTGYTGEGSPNRADALVWAISELFPGMVQPDRKSDMKVPTSLGMPMTDGGWMAA